MARQITYTLRLLAGLLLFQTFILNIESAASTSSSTAQPAGPTERATSPSPPKEEDVAVLTGSVANEHAQRDAKKAKINASSSDEELEVNILHFNDAHARFAPIGKDTNICRTADANAGKCYGGFAHISNIITEYRKTAEKDGSAVLAFNAGDTFTGTPFFSMYGEEVSAAYMNTLGLDAMALGNHEFDLGEDALIRFLKNVTFPVLAANIKNGEDHRLWKTKLEKYTIVEVKGRKIGVIGYLTPETKTLAEESDVEFIDEIDAINEVAKTLDAMKVNIIIALGHSGYVVDKQIAEKCPLVDVVVGGHTHSFLYSGNKPYKEQIVGPYPTIVTQANGKKVPVVQAYAFTKFMGRLKVKFNEKGNLIHHDGEPILLDGDVPNVPKVKALDQKYGPEVYKKMETVIGRTAIALDTSNCRLAECDTGNLLADALRHGLKDHNGDHLIAVMASGDIRGSTELGEVTLFNLETILPFDNPLMLVSVTGKVLTEVFEHSVAHYVIEGPRGEFLQVSGLKVTFDLTKQGGHRVTSIEILPTKNGSYEKLNPTKKYDLISSSFIKGGGDGFSMLKDLKATELDITVQGAVKTYFEEKGPVSPKIEGRIKIISSAPSSPRSKL